MPKVGTQGEPFEVAVELGKIREFARATFSGLTNCTKRK